MVRELRHFWVVRKKSENHAETVEIDNGSMVVMKTNSKVRGLR